VFAGDTLFVLDYGTARADFPGGNARTLYRLIQKLLALPPAARLFMCHDDKAPSRDHYAWETTVGEERASNPNVKDGISEDEFVSTREARACGAATPDAIDPENTRAGKLPAPDATCNI
jgi:glyoxylase-like metal-dependent hydrolase (beta-lactamase superfamily II)